MAKKELLYRIDASHQMAENVRRLAASGVAGVSYAQFSGHINNHWVAAHPGRANTNRAGLYFSYNYGINGGEDTDEGNNILDMINEVGANGGGTCYIRSANGTSPIYINRPVSIYYDNVHVVFQSPVIYGPTGGVRVMGEYGEYTPLESGFAFKLFDYSGTNEDGKLLFRLVPDQVQHLEPGMKITLRGKNDKSGRALEKQTTYIESISGDYVTCVDEPLFTFYDAYTDSEWGPDATTGTTIYIVRYASFISNIARGAMSAEVNTVEGFAVGDLVEVSTNETEWMINPSAISGSNNPYRNPARREYAKIVKIEGNVVTFNRALSHNYSTSNFGGISLVRPVRNSSISGIHCTYNGDQPDRRVHPLSIVYGEDCHVFDCSVDGRGGQRGQGCRIAYSYNCTVHDSTFVDPKFVGSGDGYGPSLYYSTLCRVYNCTMSGCRHGVLLQLATGCLVYNNISTDDYISAYDVHGVNSHDCIFTNNYATRSKNNSDDSSDCSAYRVGNTSHTVGDHYIVIAYNFAIGYKHTDSAGLEVLASSSNVSFVGNVVDGAEIGFRFKRNPSRITPVQTASNIELINCRFANCTQRAVEIEGDPIYDGVSSSGKLENLLIKGCTSEGNSRHFRIDGHAGITNVRITHCDVWLPVSLTNEYFINVSEVLGGCQITFNNASGANRGVKVTSTPSCEVSLNALAGTTEGVPFTDGGGNTGLVQMLNSPTGSGGGGGGGTDLSTVFSAKGQAVFGTGVGAYTTVSVGTTGQFLKVNPAQTAGVQWATLVAADISDFTTAVDARIAVAGGIPITAFTAKGDLLAGTGVGTYEALPVGTSGMLKPNPATATGLEWGLLALADIPDGLITNAKMANIPGGARVKGRLPGAGAGAPQDLTSAELISLLQSAGTTWEFAIQTAVSGSNALINYTTISGNAPHVRLIEDDQVLPDGLWRVRVESDIFRVEKNTAPAGGFSSQIIPMQILATGMSSWNYSMSVAGTIRTTGANNPSQFTGGTGLELRYQDGAGNILAYNRTSSTRVPLVLDASAFTFAVGDVTVASRVKIGAGNFYTQLNVYGPSATITSAPQAGAAATCLAYFAYNGGAYISVRHVGSAELALIAAGSAARIQTLGSYALELGTNGSTRVQITAAGVLEYRPATTAVAHLGYALVGGNPTYNGYASFSHRDRTGPGNYALMQHSNGQTILNSSAGQPLRFRIDNIDAMVLSTTGLVISGGLSFVGNLSFTGSLAVAGDLGAWTSLSLSGWSNTNEPAKYRKFGDIVYLSGVVVRGSTSIGTGSGLKVGDLPAGFRPAGGRTHSFPINVYRTVSGSTTVLDGWLHIEPDGDIRITLPANTSADSWALYLNGIFFSTIVGTT
jgi:hypothetical protein